MPGNGLVPSLPRALAPQALLLRIVVNRDLEQQPALEFHERHGGRFFGVIAVTLRHISAGCTWQ